MKKLKNLKARLLSLSLAFAMVLSLAMGMAPMKVMANEYVTPQDLLGNLYDTPIGTANVTVTVTENGVQCNNFPELQLNCKWVYSYHKIPTTHADYANLYQILVSDGKANMRSGKMGYPSVTEYPTRNQYVYDVPETGLIPLGDNGKGILNVYQVYNHAFRDANVELETRDEGYRFYCANTMLIFDTSQGGDVLNGYVDSGNQGDGGNGGNQDGGDNGGGEPTLPTPTYPTGGTIVDLGDDSIWVEGNTAKFAIPNDEFNYYTMVVPLSRLQDPNYETKTMETISKAVVDAPNNVAIDNAGAYINGGSGDYTVYAMIRTATGEAIQDLPSMMLSDQSSREITEDSIAVIYKFHKDNVVKGRYAAGQNPIDSNYPYPSDTYLFSLYGVHMERVTPPGVTPPADTHTHNLEEVPAKAPTCTTAGNNKYYTCDCGAIFKADGTTSTTVEAETLPARHSWVDAWEKDETNHWHKCSGCSEIKDSVAHSDSDSNNLCDVCSYALPITEYTITLKTNGCRAFMVAYGHNSNEGNNYIEGAELMNDGTMVIPADGKVSIICNAAFTVAAPGAKIKYGNAEGFNCIISEFKRNTTIVLDPTDTGEVTTKVNVTNDSPIQRVEIKNSIDEFIAARNIFTDTEIGEIANGVDASVRLAVTKKDNVTDTERTAMENKVAELGFNSNITFFDASFFKKVGDVETSVSEPGMELEITIQIPSDLLNSDSSKTRTYQLLRYHPGDPVKAIEGSFSNGKFTFKTDKFSTYAIIYKDVAQNSGGTPGAGSGSGSGSSGSSDSSSSSSSSTTTTATATQQLVKDDVPKTGEAADYSTMLWTSILAIGVVGLVLNRQKKRQ